MRKVHIHIELGFNILYMYKLANQSKSFMEPVIAGAIFGGSASYASVAILGAGPIGSGLAAGAAIYHFTKDRCNLTAGLTLFTAERLISCYPSIVQFAKSLKDYAVDQPFDYLKFLYPALAVNSGIIIGVTVFLLVCAATAFAMHKKDLDQALEYKKILLLPFLSFFPANPEMIIAGVVFLLVCAATAFAVFKEISRWEIGEPIELIPTKKDLLDINDILAFTELLKNADTNSDELSRIGALGIPDLEKDNMDAIRALLLALTHKQEHLPNLTELSFGRINGSFLRLLSFDKLNKLHIKSFYGRLSIAEFPNLTELVIDTVCDKADLTIMNLKKLTSLKFDEIQTEVKLAIANLENLTSLEFGKTDAHFNLIISNLDMLSELSLKTIWGNSFVMLSNLKKLATLACGDLHGNLQLFRLPSLTTLSIENIQDSGALTLADSDEPFSNLRTISLGQIWSEQIAITKTLPSLESLIHKEFRYKSVGDLLEHFKAVYVQSV